MAGSDAPRGVSAWWSLLLLPLALGIGWVVGHSEGSAPPPPSEAPAAVAAAPGPRVTEAVNTIPPATIPAAVKPSTGWQSYADAVAESKQSGKPLMLDFNAEWCPPCQRLKREVFDDRDQFGHVQTSVIPVSIVDRQREAGRNPAEIEALQRQFEVDAFPTLVVYSPGTGRAEKTVGYGGIDHTKSWIADAARSVR